MHWPFESRVVHGMGISTASGPGQNLNLPPEILIDTAPLNCRSMVKPAPQSSPRPRRRGRPVKVGLRSDQEKREEKPVNQRKRKQKPRAKNQQAETILTAQDSDARFRQVMQRWPVASRTSHISTLGARVLKTVFSTPSRSLSEYVQFDRELFESPIDDTFRMYLVESLWVDIFAAGQDLHIWNTKLNKIDEKIDRARLLSAFLSRSSNLDNIETEEQGPFTALGIKATQQGLLKHKPVLPEFWTTENGIKKPMATVAKGSKALVLESVLSQDRAITDFHLDVTIWGTYCFQIQGGKVVISAPPTAHNWDVFKSNYCREDGNDRYDTLITH